jgi:hypothetical protein
MSKKKHILTTGKQYNGQYFTTNAERILSGWENLVSTKRCIDPFCGGYDLLDWCKSNGASSVEGYDIDLTNSDNRATYRNSLIDVPDFTGKFLVSNPPFLARNKCRSGDTTPYDKWGQSDYYKCHIASLSANGCDEGILIVPSNFLSESNQKARETFFTEYNIVEAKYWNEQVFDDATTGITAFHFRRKDSVLITGFESFPVTIYPDNKTFVCELYASNKYLHGKEFFDFINQKSSYTFEKDVKPNTNIVVGSMDFGKYKTGFHYNDGEPISSPKSVITTYQVSVSGNRVVSESEQRMIVEKANSILKHYREKYHSMFLSNYLGAEQKIMSQSYSKKILGVVTTDLFSEK